jgi:phasin family protein
MLKSMDEIVAFNKGNFDAAVKTGNLAVKGFEALSKAYMAAAKVQFDAFEGYTKAISGVKNVNEAVELQNTLMKKNFDSAVAESKKLAELHVKVANDTIAPLTERVEAAQKVAEKVADFKAA